MTDKISNILKHKYQERQYVTAIIIVRLLNIHFLSLSIFNLYSDSKTADEFILQLNPMNVLLLLPIYHFLSHPLQMFMAIFSQDQTTIVIKGSVLV